MMHNFRLSVIVAAALLALSANARPADAHAGGKVQLFLKDMKVQPTDGSYTITVRLVDRDSGAAASGFPTTVEGTSATGVSFPARPMTADADGVYMLAVSTDPGDWTLTLRSGAGPGTEPAEPLVDRRRVSFPVVGVGAAQASTGSGSGSGSGSKVVPATFALIALVGAASWIARPRSQVRARFSSGRSDPALD